MELKSFVTLNKEGKVVPSAKTFVYKRSTTELAVVYNATGTAITNPLTSNSSGFIEFAAEDGAYDVRFEVNGELGQTYPISFADVVKTSTKVKEIENDSVAAKADIATLKTDVADAKTAVTGAVDDIDAVKISVDSQKTRIDTVETDTATHKTDIAANAAAIAKAKTDITGLPALVKQDFAGDKGFGMLGQVASFDKLRTLQPEYDGQMVRLRSYNTGKKRGGGLFVGFSGTQKDDGGFLAAGTGFYWHRADLDLSKLTLDDFGAFADGVTDDQPAVKRMYEFTLSPFARLLTGATGTGSNMVGGRVVQMGVKFAPGTYFISPGDYTQYGTKVWNGAPDAGQNPSGYYAAGEFKLEGPITPSGRQITVKIVSDKSANYVFLINHRRLTVHGITFDGQQTVAQDTTTKMLAGATSLDDYPSILSNQQGFLKNQCPAGQYATLTSINISNNGGPGFALQDTLDTTISQFFSSHSGAPVIQSGWSDPLNQFYGKWDHSTAIKITDCNFQSAMAPALWIPRCGQAIMDNVWFEHSYCPFDINNGQWTLSTVCIEDCIKNGIAYNAKILLTTESVPTGNKVDMESGPTSDAWGSYKKNPDGSDITPWINGYETGYAVFQSHGSYLNHPLRYKWLSGCVRGTNNVNSSLWINVGSFTTTAVGGMWEIEVMAASYLSVANAPLNVTGDRTPGKAVILIQRGGGSDPKVTWHQVGNSAVNAVKYTKPFNTVVGQLWVQIGAYTGEYSITVKGSGDTRREAGTPSMFNIAGNTQTATPTGTVDAIGRFSITNGRAGVGAQDDMLALTTAVLNSSEVYTDAFVQYHRWILNGVVRVWPVYAMRPVITTQPTAQAVAVGGTLTLTVAANYTKTAGSWDTYQWYKDNVAISGATGATFTKANVTTDDAGSYKVQVRGDTAAANTKDSNAVAVTVA